LFLEAERMPLPTPNEGESEQDFISRCMGNETMNEDFPEQEQRSAVCYRQWREKKGIEMNDTGTDEIQVDGNAFDRSVKDSNYVATLAVVDEEGGVYEPSPSNALKAISRTDDTLTVANYLVLFGGRDLEGVGSPRVNPDGSRGEYFMPDTELESDYTKAGVVFVDWEHGTDDYPSRDDVLGVVDWKTARKDERGWWVERVLNRRSQYVKWLEELIDEGIIGTSSEAIDGQVEKAADGRILRWPLRRDTLTVTPMEPRMITENHLQAFKALGIPVPDDKVQEPEPEPEASPEADTSAVDVARARARLQQILLSLEE
jgi:hypothetical protein